MSAESLTALITGGTEGLGRAMALRLAREGYRVFAAGRSKDRRALLADDARKLGLPITPLEMDVCDDSSVDRGIAELRSMAGSVDVLINNAGIAYPSTMEEIRLEHLRQQFETNFFGAVRLIQRVLPEMRARRRGWIVNMSSGSGRFSLPIFGPYSSSKFALEAMSDTLRNELIPFGVRVILIEPSFIPTNMGKTASELVADYRELSESGPYAELYRGFLKFWNTITSASRTTPEDCAEIVLAALQARNPLARYTVPAKDKRGLWLVRLLPDRMTDKLVARQFGIKKSCIPVAPKAK